MSSAIFKTALGVFLISNAFVFTLLINENVVLAKPHFSSKTTSGSPIQNIIGNVISEPSLQEKNIFILVNVERSKQTLRAVKWDPDLWKMAEYYSRKMADENFFDHLDPDGKSVVDRAKQFKINKWTKIGENLFFADGYISPTGEAVAGWMNSEGHRENILDKDWTHSAIGVYEARGRKTYVTQLFLRR